MMISNNFTFGTQLPLSSSIIEDIDCEHRSGLASLAFYYFDFRDQGKKDTYGLLSSLLYQLFNQSDSYCDILSRVYSMHRDGAQSPEDSALMECLREMLRAPEQAPVYLVLDALDECPDSCGTPSPREEVLVLVENLVNLHLPKLRICLTSRPEGDIAAVLEPLDFRSITLPDEEGQRQDIRDYVKSMVHSDKKMQRWEAEEKELVIDVLSQKANGM
jgi:hypothetical protein